MTTPTAVSVTGLTKRYGARTVVSDFDLELPTGVPISYELKDDLTPARPRRLVR